MVCVAKCSRPALGDQWTQDFSLSPLLQAAVVMRKAEFLWGYIPLAVFPPVALPRGG